ncbi:MAG: DUF4398 domain-containing protein [Lysobacterales bacterium]
MTPRTTKIHAFITVSAVLGLAACSPARPPLADLDAAARGLAAARAANAPMLAPADFTAARSRLDQAQSAEQDGDFDAAGWFARESAASSELAEARARAATLRKAIDQLRTQNADLRANLGPDAPPGDGQ